MPKLIDHPRRWGAAVLLFLALGVASAGCSTAPAAPTTQPATMQQRQNQALADPFGYTPDTKNSDMTVSGHGEFDKEGLKRDTDFVLNP